MADEVSTPINTVSRDNLTVLIRNNMLNTSLEFASDCDTMETDSPLPKPPSQPISKRLFHSPAADSPVDHVCKPADRARRPRKRKQNLIPNSSEKIKKAFVRECEEGCSPNGKGMRKTVLISLFHNKEYSMDVS